MSNSLPVVEALPELIEKITACRSVVLQAPPGAGKTTLVPLELLKQPLFLDKSIIVLEPRRLAARNSACRMAQLLNEPVGKTVGYRVRMESKVSAQTRIEVMTEGVFLRKIQADPELADVGCVIFDEFHERGLNSDLALALTRDVQEGFNEELRLLIMSATLNTKELCRSFGDVPVVSSEGRCFPVEVKYYPYPKELRIVDAVCRVVLEALAENEGSILVFLPGKAEIQRVASFLEQKNLAATEVYSLYGNLSFAQQERAIEPAGPGCRKVVLATNIAETSLTIEGVRVVIDSGLYREPVFNPNSGMTTLTTRRIPRSSAEQRAGRAGRMEPGVCYRLWSEQMHNQMTPFSEPEIVTAELSNLMLELAQWGTIVLGSLSWVDLPPDHSVSEAKGLLKQLEAIDSNGRITAHGQQMVDLGLHPRLAHMIIKGDEMGCGVLACDLAALISEKDIFSFSNGYENCDITARAQVLNSFRTTGSFDRQGNPQKSAVKRIVELSGMWARKARVKRSDHYDVDRCGVLLGFAYFDRIAGRRDGSENRYLLSSGSGAYFDLCRAFYQDKYVVAANLAGRDKEAKIFLAAPITKDDIYRHFSALCSDSVETFWNSQTETVQSRIIKRLGELVLESKPSKETDAEQVTQVLLDTIRVLGLECLPWSRDTRDLIARINFIHRSVDPDWPDCSEQALLDSLESWLAPFLAGITSRSQFKRIELKSALLSAFDWNKQQKINRLAPTHLSVPSGAKIRLDYLSGDIPVLPVKLQKMFGATETPRIGGGKVPVLIHLLSPAQRPVQITQDLAGFWASSYELVKKDLKGRYPKHDWPDLNTCQWFIDMMSNKK